MNPISNPNNSQLKNSSNKATSNSLEEDYSYHIPKITQFLLDWINTIKEPHCLLASDLQSLRNGNIFIEYLKHFLMRQGAKKEEININPKLDDKKKLMLLLDAIRELSNEENKKRADKFLNEIDSVFTNDYVLIELLSFLRELFEQLESTAIQSVVNSNSKIKKIKKKIRRENTFSESELKKEDFIIEILSKNNRDGRKKKFDNLTINTNTSSNDIKHKKCLSFCKSNDFSMLSKNTHKEKNYTLIHNKIISKNNSNIKDKSEKNNQIELGTGIYSFPPKQKTSIANHFRPPIPLFKFYHPTSPIVDITKNTLTKMKPMFNSIESTAINRNSFSYKHMPKKNKYNLNSDSINKKRPLKGYYQIYKKENNDNLEINPYNSNIQQRKLLKLNNDVNMQGIYKEEMKFNMKNQITIKRNNYNPPHFLYLNQKEKPRSFSKGSILSSDNNSSVSNWKDIREDKLFCKQITKQKKKNKNDRNEKVKCFLLFDKNNISKMKSEMIRKYKSFRRIKGVVNN